MSQPDPTVFARLTGGTTSRSGSLRLSFSHSTGQAVLFATDTEGGVVAQINLTPGDLDALADAADSFRATADALTREIEMRQGADHG